MWWIMKLLEGFKFKAFIAIMAKALEAVFELMMPLMMARLIDVGIRHNNSDVVKNMALWLFVLTLLGYMASLVCQYMASVVAHRVGYRYRKELFAKIQGFDEASYDHYDAAMLVNRLTTDVYNIQDMINRVIRLGVRAPILMIGSVVALYSINARLALTLLVTLPLFVVVLAVFMRGSLKGHRNATKSLDVLTEKVSESLAGTRIIRAFSKQKLDVSNFKLTNNRLRDDQKKVGIIATLSSPFTSLLMNGVLVYLVYLGALEINVGNMSQGQVIAVINYCTQLVLTLIVTMNIIMVVAKGLVSKSRIEAVYETQPVVNFDKGAPVPESFDLVFDAVSYNYPSEKRNVIENVSFSLNQGEVLGIVGLTGSGKSTLIRLIPRFMDATSGNILVGNQPLQSLDLQALRQCVGYISQSAQFLKGSLKDNILMGHAGDYRTALMHAQGQDILNKGDDLMIEEGGKNLSGGQRQRVNIARALAKNPKLLIFDDSFSALDYLTDKKLRASLSKNYADVSQIIISQRTSTVRHATKILVIDKGRIIATGTHDELLETCDLYRKIHTIQSQGGQDDHEEA